MVGLNTRSRAKPIVLILTPQGVDLRRTVESVGAMSLDSPRSVTLPEMPTLEPRQAPPSPWDSLSRYPLLHTMKELDPTGMSPFLIATAGDEILPHAYARAYGLLLHYEAGILYHPRGVMGKHAPPKQVSADPEKIPIHGSFILPRYLRLAEIQGDGPSLDALILGKTKTVIDPLPILKNHRE